MAKKKLTIDDLPWAAKQYDKQLNERFNKIDKKIKELKQKVNKLGLKKHAY